MKNPSGYRVVLDDLTQEERRDYARLVGILSREWGEERITLVLLRALREAAAKT